ncbi:MAG: rRNA pseudouridine synthase, partial [Treponema sp.]|nr:rRNA pseudouridine synthase [Treponema sp.]
LFFTTDGALTHKIISPKTHFPNQYFVRLKKSESVNRQNEIKDLFYKGIHIPAEGNESEADCTSADLIWQSENEALLTITEGKFHQVKRMFLAVNNEVVYLKRLSIGALKLDEKLAVGEYRELTDEEVQSLMIPLEL